MNSSNDKRHFLRYSTDPKFRKKSDEIPMHRRDFNPLSISKPLSNLLSSVLKSQV